MDTLKKVPLLRVICVAFKVAAVRAYLTGQPPMEIFLDSGFHLDAIGHDKPKKCLLRWRQVFTARGEEGLLEEMRGKQATGRRNAGVKVSVSGYYRWCNIEAERQIREAADEREVQLPSTL